MQYQKPSFTLPVSSGKLTQTDWEIRVGLRNSDGSLKRPKTPKTVTVEITHYADYLNWDPHGILTPKRRKKAKAQ